MSLLLLPQAWAMTEDNSIIDQLDSKNTKALDIDFSMKNFESCDAFENVMEKYLKSYWENHYKNTRFDIMYSQPMMMEKTMSSDEAVSSNKAVWGAKKESISETNTQVKGVDESDIVKTDGKHHYYYNESKKAVYIVDAKSLEVVKKINLPKSFSNSQLYITKNRLIIIASGYSKADYSKKGYFINRNTKTYTIVYDTSDINNLSLLKLYSNDGSYGKSRRIGDYVYVLSRNYISYPYWNIKNADDISIDAEKMLPKKLDISRTSNTSEQNLQIKGKKLPFHISAGNVANCNAISYSFPSEESMKKMDFNPGYNIISAINIKNTQQDVKTHVLAGSNSEIYMSQDNLYLTEGMWQADHFSCPRWAMCAMPFFWGGTQNTLIHKIGISGKDMNYKASTLVPGSPLTQYSMDEYKDNFRIITSEWNYDVKWGESSTSLYILDKNLKKISDLTRLAPGERFQSSRFIGDKLFLVTFEQIDPLFAIDVSDAKKPTILGELKIPGYSTYLHPYDETHLIGLGYDTEQNKWGGVQNAGVKVDLYKINYDKKCGDTDLSDEQKKKCASGDYKGIIVEQKYTKTMGWKGSYSEALNNPRMFVWNKDKNMLLLPATLYEKDDNYRTTDYYNGLFAVEIDANTGISLKNRASHIDMAGIKEARDKECSKYSGNSGKPVCKELLDGSMHCESERKNSYVPNYCYKDSTLWQFIGDKQWEYRDMQVKRALYVWDTVYAISDSNIGSYDWNLKNKSLTPMK